MLEIISFYLFEIQQATCCILEEYWKQQRCRTEYILISVYVSQVMQQRYRILHVFLISCRPNTYCELQTVSFLGFMSFIYSDGRQTGLDRFECHSLCLVPKVWLLMEAIWFKLSTLTNRSPIAFWHWRSKQAEGAVWRSKFSTCFLVWSVEYVV